MAGRANLGLGSPGSYLTQRHRATHLSGSAGGRIGEPPTHNPGCRRVGVGGSRASAPGYGSPQTRASGAHQLSAAVTSPPEHLGTHDRSAETEGQVYQPTQPVSKGRGFHVVRITPERRVAPCRVRSIHSRCASSGPARETTGRRDRASPGTSRGPSGRSGASVVNLGNAGHQPPPRSGSLQGGRESRPAIEPNVLRSRHSPGYRLPVSLHPGRPRRPRCYHESPKYHSRQRLSRVSRREKQGHRSPVVGRPHDIHLVGKALAEQPGTYPACRIPPPRLARSSSCTMSPS